MELIAIGFLLGAVVCALMFLGGVLYGTNKSCDYGDPGALIPGNNSARSANISMAGKTARPGRQNKEENKRG